jgi:uncharacterized HAD superfamily protein
VKIIGFDLDGVAAKVPLGLHRLLRGCQKEWNILLKTPIGTLAYEKLRFVDKDTKELICGLHANGHKIIIITYVLKDGQKKVTKWLIKNGVPFDKTVAPEENENPLKFKIRAVLEERCDFFVEDQIALARGISLEAPGAKVIHYRSKEDLNILKELR